MSPRFPARRSRLITLSACVIAFAGRASAQTAPSSSAPPSSSSAPPSSATRPTLTPSQAQSDARLLAANPDAPAVGLLWRGALHGTVAARIPIYGALGGTGFLLQLPAMIELHNRGQWVVPYEYWRARLWLEAIYRRAISVRGHAAAVSGSIAVEHESDHPTAVELTYGGFVNLNSVATHGDFTIALGPHALTLAAVARLHFLTCTVDVITCGNGGGEAGSVTFETSADVVFDGVFVPGAPWRFFGALHGAWLFGNGLAATERRVVMDTGFAVRVESGGLFQIYATFFAGSDMGYYRNTDVIQGGAGFRWGF